MRHTGRKITALALALLMLLSPCLALAAPPSEESRLVIYTSHKAEVYQPIIREFESRTGLWVQLESGGTMEMLQRLRQESAAPVCDLMFGGGVESLEAYGDCFAPCPLKALPAEGNGKWAPFSSLPMVLIYNPKLTDAPTGWRALLDSRFCGRIAFADPTVSASSYTALATLLLALPEEGALERFVENLSGVVQEGSGDVVGAVSSGACLVGVTLEETALKGIAGGSDIAMVYPAEGTSAVPDGAALVAGAPHPENALLFLEFMTSADVQAYLPTLCRRSALDETEDFPLLDYDIYEAGAQKAAVLQRWSALLGEAAP